MRACLLAIGHLKFVRIEDGCVERVRARVCTRECMYCTQCVVSDNSLLENSPPFSLIHMQYAYSIRMYRVETHLTSRLQALRVYARAYFVVRLCVCAVNARTDSPFSQRPIEILRN